MDNYGLLTHTFNVGLAVEYGLNDAIILGNIHYWVTKNEANGVNLHEGRYWTYNSIAAFSELFPYLTTKQIRGALDRLVKRGLILKGNFNKTPTDRTTWYALTDKGYAAFGQPAPHSPHKANGFAHPEGPICPGGQMDLPHKANGFALEGKAIPDINTDKKPSSTSAGAAATRPTREESRRFCASNALSIDPDRFFEMNERRGWVTKSGKPIGDWERLALAWNKHEEGGIYICVYGGDQRRVPSVVEVMRDFRVNREKAEGMIQEGLY